MMVASPWPWRVIAAALILASGALHVHYLAADCPLDLAPDEAHYWHWSRHLDASYYSKGPLVAWLIRGSCELLGDRPFAVRVPAVVCGSLLLLSLYVLAVQTSRREPLAVLVVAAALTVPAFSVGRTLMTIDAPYACCWGWALVLGHAAMVQRRGWAWLPLGLIVGVGVLAKYTMVLWLPSAALFLLISPDHRPLLRRRGFWLACAVAGLCCLPVVWWNVRHDWVSLRHVGGQAGVAARSSVRWLGPLEYVGGQFGLLFGFWFVAWVMAMVAHRPTRDADPSRRYLWCLSAPMFLFFGVFSLRTEVLLNWPITAYLGGLVLAAPALVDRLRAGPPWQRLATRGWLAVACAIGITMTLAAHNSVAVQPLLAVLAGPPTDANPQPLRRIDPTCRMRGWRFLAANVDDVRREVGGEPVLAASRWTLASELAFYCDGHPTVYSLGSVLWDRQSQFDLWRPNPIRDPATFRGSTFIFVDVGKLPPEIVAAFNSVEPRRTYRYEESGQLIAFWDVTICRGFRGFAKGQAKKY